MNCRLTTLKDNFGVLSKKRGVGVVCSKSGSIQLKKHIIYNKHMKSEKTSVAKQKAYLSRYIQELKSNTPCMDCKINYPYYVMDFDHVRGRKHKNVMELIPTLSKKKIDEEIAKCEIVCSNCHRIRTHQRKLKKAGK